MFTPTQLLAFYIPSYDVVVVVTPLALRNWDRDGKLKAYRNPINNYRVYKSEEIELFLRKIESSRKFISG